MTRASVLVIALMVIIIAVLSVFATAYDVNSILNEMTNFDSGLDDWLVQEILNDHVLTTEITKTPEEQRKFLEAHGYVHSKFFDADGKLNAPSLDQIKLQAKLSGASYCISRNAQALADWVCRACPATEIKMTGTTVYNLDGYQLGVYVGYDATHNVIRVVYRGSANFSNWLANLAFAKVSLGGGKGQVHSGFRTAYLQSRPQIISKIDALRAQHGNRAIQVTGHSLGGAVALLAALDLKTGLSTTNFGNGFTHISSELFPEPLPLSSSQLLSLGATTTLTAYPLTGPLITFGQPRVGDQAFANWAAGQLASNGYFRVTHRHDPVPRVPTQSMGFAHINPTEIYFTEPEAATNYRICAGGSSEDPSCIIGPLVNLSIGDHSWYAGTYLPQSDATCARR